MQFTSKVCVPLAAERRVTLTLLMVVAADAVIAAATNAVVAMEVSLSPGLGVTARASPVNTGAFKGALAANSPCTKAVVAMERSLSPGAGDEEIVGFPVNTGELMGA